ncbi:hypothetical protein EMIT0111MI5_30194 [Burkholderia sp. IT-111MI5]
MREERRSVLRMGPQVGAVVPRCVVMVVKNKRRSDSKNAVKEICLVKNYESCHRRRSSLMGLRPKCGNYGGLDDDGL